MARPPKARRGPRPEQGAHLLALRQKAGLTQIELAEIVGVTQAAIAVWEWSDAPPRSKDLGSLANALGVTVQDLVLQEGTVASRKPGRVGEVQRLFDEIRQLPRRQQRKIIETVVALVDSYKRKSA
jgi:transcriptional regulator with XRE-family HTH domain